MLLMRSLAFRRWVVAILGTTLPLVTGCGTSARYLNAVHPQYGQTESTAVRSLRGTSGSVTALLTSAPVGHAATHSPHETHVLSPIGKLANDSAALMDTACRAKNRAAAKPALGLRTSRRSM